MQRHLIALFLTLFTFAAPVAAQEATPEPTAPAVLEAPAVGGDLIVESGGVVNVEQPAPVIEEPAGIPESTQVALVIAVAGVLGVAIVAYAVSQGKTPQQVYWSLPTPVTQYGVPFAWDAAYRQARTTASTADDEALLAIATTLGYVVTTLPDGRMVLSRAEPAAPPAAS